MTERVRAVAGIQARMGSSRLPGKSLADVAGKPLVERVFERAAAARELDAVVVLTSTSPADDALAEHCEARGMPVRRGPEDDVLARYLALVAELEPRFVVRVTGDCPFVAPELIDLQLEALERFDADRATLPEGWPTAAVEGQGVLSARALVAAAESDDPRDREHVGSFWLARHAAELRTVELACERWLARDDVRLCVDEPADLALARRVYEHFADGESDGPVPLRDVLRFLDANSGLRASNLCVRNAADTAAAHAARRAAPRTVVGRWPA